MKTLLLTIRFFRIASLLVRHFRVLTEDHAVWRKEDAVALLAYLQTPSGVRMMEIMRHKAYRAAVEACGCPPEKMPVAAGFHNGFRAALAVMVTLSATGEPQSLYSGLYPTGHGEAENNE